MTTYNVQAPDQAEAANRRMQRAERPPAQPQDSPQQTAAYQLFDQAREAFKKGDYATALQELDTQAIQSFPKDPVLHEFAALCLFATGDYNRSAAVLNSLLAAAPGMDWTTMASLYADTMPIRSNCGPLRRIAARIPTTRPPHSCWGTNIWSSGLTIPRQER